MKSKISSPYDKRDMQVKRSSCKAAGKAVKPVSKDTNKTQRRIVKPTREK